MSCDIHIDGTTDSVVVEATTAPVIIDDETASVDIDTEPKVILEPDQDVTFIFQTGGAQGPRGPQEVFVGAPAMLPLYPALVFEEITIDGEDVYQMSVNVP